MYRIISVLIIICVLKGAELQRPSEYRIPNIPYHRQLTRYACGDASFEMVYHHYRQDLDQRAIIDVSRTSFAVGTNTFDLIRAAHFSNLSQAATNYLYPEQAPTNGWKKSIPYGMPAFGYYAEECWISELKDVISQGYPVIVLNHFSLASPGGHFRVAMGYNDSSITLLDPWDRDWPRIVSFSDEEFCNFIWKIPEQYYNITTPSYWGGLLAPLSLNLSFDALNISKRVDQKQYYYIVVNSSLSYPCPAPFCSYSHPQNADDFILSNVNISLSLPFNMQFYDNSPPSFSLSSLSPNSMAQFSWTVEIDDAIEVKFPDDNSFNHLNNIYGDSVIRVLATGYLSGVVPEAVCCYDDKSGDLKYYPAYNYTDVIGQTAQVHY